MTKKNRTRSRHGHLQATPTDQFKSGLAYWREKE